MRVIVALQLLLAHSDTARVGEVNSGLSIAVVLCKHEKVISSPARTR